MPKLAWRVLILQGGEVVGSVIHRALAVMHSSAAEGGKGRVAERRKSTRDLRGASSAWHACCTDSCTLTPTPPQQEHRDMHLEDVRGAPWP